MIPKALIGRDPRNYQHVEIALKIVHGLAASRVLASTMKDMQQLGLPLPPDTKVQKVIRPNNMAIGAAFLLEVGLYYPDNVVRLCSECRLALQFRPQLAHSVAIKICAFCAAERLLKEQSEKARKKGRR